MTAKLASLAILPLMPASEEIVQTLGLNSPRKALETYCQDADVEEGDQLIVGGTAYVVRFRGSWPWDGSSGFMHLVVEENV